MSLCYVTLRYDYGNYVTLRFGHQRVTVFKNRAHPYHVPPPRSRELQRLLSTTLQRYVRIYRNLRLRDKVRRRGGKAKREGEPKPYPLESGEWSSCDESEEESPDGWLGVEATMGF